MRIYALHCPPSPPDPVPSITTSWRFVPEGRRNSTLVSLAGSLRNQGASEERLFLVLEALNKGCCQPPLPDAEVRQICKSAGNWTPGVSGKVSSREVMGVKKIDSLMSEEFLIDRN